MEWPCRAGHARGGVSWVNAEDGHGLLVICFLEVSYVGKCRTSLRLSKAGMTFARLSTYAWPRGKRTQSMLSLLHGRVSKAL